MEEKEIIPVYSDKRLDYLKILRALNEIKFGVGKNLLIDFLYGDMKNPSVKKNELYELYNFGLMKDYEKDEIKSRIDNLISNGMIDVNSLIGNKFASVLGITSRGSEELMNPSLHLKKISANFHPESTTITEDEKKVFEEMGFFFGNYNDAQKKAIISQKKNIICIAGAGSGKTSVLTKRIEFLVKYKSISPQKILAITFTRKARQEMEARLAARGISNVYVETFNSFSEKILKKYSGLAYSRPTRIMDYSDKIFAISFALQNIGIDINTASERYFSDNQKKNKEPGQLTNIFMNDCFSVLEYFKSKRAELYDFSKEVDDEKDEENARMISKICMDLQDFMKTQGLRDYIDQIIDVINLFNKNPQCVPEFEHILIDEYQDVNAMQIELLDLIWKKNPSANVFAVGDPRQSIFGWRGSDIQYILKFHEKYPECETIHLVKNYRSAKAIVDFMNHSIRNMGVPDLEPENENNSELKIESFDSEEDEQSFVLKNILEYLKTGISGENIFVLARTNRQLNEMSQKLKAHSIPHIVKNDELRRPVEGRKGDVTLATIHAIKGLEAKIVFVIGCNELNFPCKASDHPVIEIVKLGMQEYDREEEERRLFYVAISRAKEKLFLTYSGKKPTYFINSEMLKLAEQSFF